MSEKQSSEQTESGTSDVEKVENEQDQAGEDLAPLTFLEVLGSTFSAAVGVQSKARRNRDFSRGKPLHFVLAGLIFAVTFVAVVVAVVRAVLSQVS